MGPTQASDPGLQALLHDAAGDRPLRGTHFVNDAREMLLATREIEAAARDDGAVLYVGFQDAARLDDESDVYRELQKQADVIAYGVGQPKAGPDRVEWVAVPRDRHALHNQWFLVLHGTERLAFVGFETSPPKYFRRGPSYNEGRTWEGFTTDDEGLIDHLTQRLEHARSLASRRPTTWMLAATDDGSDPRYAAVRDAALAAARDSGAGVVLYDRTTESYLTNPYPSGPWSSEEAALSPSWELSPARLAVDRGAKALRDAVDRYAPDAIYLPAHVSNPSLLDRVRGNTLTTLAGAVDVPVRLVDADGEVTEHG
ncbi:MAG TPA: DICT sensory domain-containing protein [Euzebyales bacterium]